MRFKDYLDKTALEINKELEKFFNSWREELHQYTKSIDALNDLFVDANQGGKRIRGSLIKLGFLLYGGKDLKEITKIAAAYEVFQTALLIHDDIIDQDLERRGKKTIHARLGNGHRAKSLALLLADMGYFLAFRVIAESKIAKLFSETAIVITVGQILDFEKLEKEKVDLLKTAKYTVTSPLKIGATLAGANKTQLKLLEEFGDNLGIAYQIKDDFLDGDDESREGEMVRLLKKSKAKIGKIAKGDEYTNLLLSFIEYLMERKS